MSFGVPYQPALRGLLRVFGGSAQRRLLVTLVLAWPLGAVSAWSVAHADAANVEPAEYRAAVEEAVLEFEAGRFQESRALFMRAHQLYPNARTLRGLGMTEFELRNYAESVHNLESALESKVRTLEGELRDETERLLKRARGFVARVTLELKPEGARVAVDGIMVRVGPGQALLLTVGEHVLDIQADGYHSERRVLSIKSGGGDESQSFQLRPLNGVLPPARPTSTVQRSAQGLSSLPPPAWQAGRATPLPSATQPSPAVTNQPRSPASPKSPPERSSTPAKTSKTGAWVLTGISGALLVGGAVLTGLGFKDVSSVEDAKDGSSWSTVEKANQRAPILTGTGFAIGAVGLVGLVAGLAWGLRHPRRDRPSGHAARRLMLAQGHF